MVYLASDERGRADLSEKHGLSGIQPEDFAAFYRKMYKSVNIYGGWIFKSDEYAFSFDIINSVWALQPGIAERFGGALVWPVELNMDHLYYKEGSMGAGRRINEWFSRRTGLDRHEIIGENEISPEISAITVSSVNLSAVWPNALDYTMISPDLFNGLKSNGFVEMMRTSAMLGDLPMTRYMLYAEGEDYETIYIPFRYFYRHFAAVFILPKEESCLQKIEEKLSASFLERIMSDLHPFSDQFNLDMRLPRFIITGKNHVEEVSAVQSNGNKLTCKVVSPARVEISERGVKTFNTLQCGEVISYYISQEDIKKNKEKGLMNFHATRPFLFCIFLNIDHDPFLKKLSEQSRPSLDTILLMGRYTGPKN
jgi:serine protease inhibitor